MTTKTITCKKGMNVKFIENVLYFKYILLG